MKSAAWALLLLIVAASALAPLYAAKVSGTDPFRSDPNGSVAGQPVLALNPSVGETPIAGLGVTPIGPGWRGAYLLGADAVGRDVAARLLYGGRTSLLIAAAASLLCLVVGGLAGIVSGYLGGLVDTVIAGLLDLLWAFPVYLLAISLSIVLLDQGLRIGPFEIGSGSLALPVLILGTVYIPYVARPVRAEVMALHEREFVEAARATGGSRLHVLHRHILPMAWPTLLGLAPVVAALMLLTEASLSVLGIGVQPPQASWGTLIADGQTLIYSRPWVAIAPGLAVVATVLALNVLADRHA